MLDVVRARHRPRAGARQRGRGPRVGAEPPAARRADVHGVTDDRVAEREPPRDAGLAHEHPREQLVERGQPVVQLGDLGRERRLERVADDGGRVEQPPGGRRQAGQFAGQRRGDGGRVARAAPGTAGRSDATAAAPARAASGGVAGELLQVERVAACLRVEPAGCLPHELARLGLAQRPAGAGA